MRNRLFQAAAVLVFMVPACVQAGEITLRTTPCRLYDSRYIGSAGSGSAITTATIDATATGLDSVTQTVGAITYNAQGGQSGCKVPATATGVALNVVLYSPSGAGWGRVWAKDSTEPWSTSINSSGALNESTMLMATLGTDGKLSFHSSYSGQLIIDLAGWVEPEEIPFGGYIGAIQANDTDIVWQIGLFGLPVVCMEPFIDPNGCGVQPLNDIVCGLGHIGYYGEGPYTAGPHLIVDQLLPCPI